MASLSTQQEVPFSHSFVVTPLHRPLKQINKNKGKESGNLEGQWAIQNSHMTSQCLVIEVDRMLKSYLVKVADRKYFMTQLNSQSLDIKYVSTYLW